FFFFQAEDGIRDDLVTGVQTCALPIFGGHTREIAGRLATGLVIANDRDTESLEFARANTLEFAQRIRFHQGKFSELKEAIREQGLEKVNGLLADLGVSRYQLTESHRGVSLLTDGLSAIRMDR